MRPIHPGEVLREDFLIPLGLTPEGFAQQHGIDVAVLHAVAIAETGIIDQALSHQLSAALGTTPEFWINLQTLFDRARPAP
jgi:addiction module HigA family antidote